jgi:hypothetical protein
MASRRGWWVLKPSRSSLVLLRLITWRSDDMPGHIESMFDDCDSASDASSVLRRASKNEAGWLARFARKRVEQEREAFELGLERDLQVISAPPSSCRLSLTQRSLQSACPPREVRSFRVLLMRDACATRRPARRVVELTAWDVLTLSFDEAPAGQFKEGQRFQVRLLGMQGVSVYSYLLGFEFASDAEECVDGSWRGRRTCISQHC